MSPRRVLAYLHDITMRLLAFLLYYAAPVLRARLRGGPVSGVLALHPGQRRHPGGRWAIVVAWHLRSCAWSLDNLLAALDRGGVNVLLVSNAAPDPATQAALLARCATLMLRDNSGFDFGAYRDAVLHLSVAEPAVERLLLVNDSVLFYRAGLDALLARLLPPEGGADVIAGFENFERHFHFQSFLLSLSGPLLRHPEVQQFWRDYLPIGNRRWAIHKGEVALSTCLLRAGHSFEVIAASADLAEALARAGITEMLGLHSLFARDLHPQWARLEKLGIMPGADADVRRGLALEITQIGLTRSPVHCAPFLYPRYLGINLLKRDLVWREQFSLPALESNLRAVGLAEHSAEVMAEMRRRGSGGLLRGLARGAYQLGIR